jgi:hypothetical protein
VKRKDTEQFNPQRYAREKERVSPYSIIIYPIRRNRFLKYKIMEKSFYSQWGLIPKNPPFGGGALGRLKIGNTNKTMAAGPTVKEFPYRTGLVNNATLTRYPVALRGEAHPGPAGRPPE